MKLAAVSEQIVNSSVYQGSVERLTLFELCAVSDEIVSDFNFIHDPDLVMIAVQTQLSLLRVVLDAKAVGNFHHLHTKVFGHAVLCVAATRKYPSPDDGSLIRRLRALYPANSDFDFHFVLSQLCSKLIFEQH